MNKYNIGLLLLTVLCCTVITIINASSVPTNEFKHTAPSTDVSAESADPALININTATVEQLDMLPGIGSSRAEEIVKYREKHGGFITKDEIMNVDGIGTGIFSEIEKLITVD